MFDDLIPQNGQSPFSGAISSVESGGRYDALGPQTHTGDRAYGKYQVMGANIGPWSEEVLGRKLTPQEFASSPEAQEAIFNAKFGSYVQKYGPEGAARAWFAGEKGMNNPNARDILGTSVTGYAEKFNKALGFAPEGKRGNVTIQAPAKSPNALSFDDLIPQQQAPTFDQRFQQPDTQNPALQAGLERQAAQMTTGPQQSPAAQLAVAQRNLLSGAQQGASPHPDQYKGNLVSAETFESDSGEVMYRDPATGQVVPTDQSRQVALRDPADGVIKVYDRSAQTNESGVTGAARVLAPGLASGAATARPSIPVSSKEIVPKASDIFSTAKPHYREFERAASKVEVPAQTAGDFATRIRGSLDKANFIEELAPPVYKAVAILDKGEPLTLDALQNIKRVVGRSFNSPDKNVRDAAAVASKEIAKIMGEVSPGAAQSLKRADDIHSTARSVQDLSRKSDIAGLRTARSGYGGNAVNNMRTQIEKIVEADITGKKTGFKPDEIQAMRDIVNGDWLTNTARNIGALSPSKGVIQIGTAIGTAGATAVAGGLANKLASVLTGKQIERLNTLVAKRSPAYAEAVARATTKYERAQMELVNNPSPAKFAAYLSASRALASGLQRDGVQVTAGDLLRAIQGPMKSAADDEQPEPEREVNQ